MKLRDIISVVYSLFSGLVMKNTELDLKLVPPSLTIILHIFKYAGIKRSKRFIFISSQHITISYTIIDATEKILII